MVVTTRAYLDEDKNQTTSVLEQSRHPVDCYLRHIMAQQAYAMVSFVHLFNNRAESVKNALKNMALPDAYPDVCT